MAKISNQCCFCIVSFGFIFLVVGVSVLVFNSSAGFCNNLCYDPCTYYDSYLNYSEAAYYDHTDCVPTCTDRCTLFFYGDVDNTVSTIGIAFTVSGSILVFFCCPVTTRKLAIADRLQNNKNNITETRRSSLHSNLLRALKFGVRPTSSQGNAGTEKVEVEIESKDSIVQLQSQVQELTNRLNQLEKEQKEQQGAHEIVEIVE